MQITVTGQQIDVGETLREHATRRLGEGVEKYFDQAMVGHVVFSRDGSRYRTHIQVRVGKGMAWESQADNADIRLSLNEAVERLEKQLRRHKRKLRDHNKGGDGVAAHEA
ncbi:MAG: ribosome hibernation-promoting factor, HPF/YfiA family [Alphaproteobacteria bacterium]